MNKKTTKTIGNGELGKTGNANDILQWLNSNIPAKGKSVAKNLEIMQQISPEPIKWTEGVVVIAGTAPKDRARTTDKWIVTPGAHVMIVGETDSGDDIRYVSFQGEGAGRMSIANGKVYTGSHFTNFADEL